METKLGGWFKNCYGLQDFQLNEVDFSGSGGRPANRAIIYAPNGVMKTSFAKVFEDISKKRQTTDRVFGKPSSYEVTYRGSTYSSANLAQVEEIYVIDSFNDLFECRETSIPLLLADDEARSRYQETYSRFADVVERFRNGLAKTGDISRAKLQEQVISDFGLPEKSDWMDIFTRIHEGLDAFTDSQIYDGFKYSDMFNDTTAKIFADPTFLQAVREYVTRLNELISGSTLLSNDFDDRNADQLGKSLKSNNLFKAQHSIQLKDGTAIQNLEEWNSRLASERDKLYGSSTLKSAFEILENQLTANLESHRLRQILRSKPEIVELLGDVPALKRKMWLHWVLLLQEPFDASYRQIMGYREEIRAIYEQASSEKQSWQGVIDEFNRRFNVPFRVTIENQSDVILKNQVPKVGFRYERPGIGDEATETASYNDRKEIMKVLSTGEMRALYLLYVLFDVRNIISSAKQDSKKRLVITDDIADSFDYKNKYAIVQYLEDISSVENIDLLLLTHNFDFYRTACSRLSINDKNCYIVQKRRSGTLNMDRFGRQTDYFKDTILKDLKDGSTASEEDRKKALISSIPFCRNLAGYAGNTQVHEFLTRLLHLKRDDPDSASITVAQLWQKLREVTRLAELPTVDGNDLVIALIGRIASCICEDADDETSLMNKIVVSIATRLEAEAFLERVLERKNISRECSCDQTRDWANKALPHLKPSVQKIVATVCLMTPEEIHVNAFMYEPIIDMSDWALKDLFKQVKSLSSDIDAALT